MVSQENLIHLDRIWWGIGGLRAPLNHARSNSFNAGPDRGTCRAFRLFNKADRQ
jgi:hypothetical protein